MFIPLNFYTFLHYVSCQCEPHYTIFQEPYKIMQYPCFDLSRILHYRMQIMQDPSKFLPLCVQKSGKNIPSDARFLQISWQTFPRILQELLTESCQDLANFSNREGKSRNWKRRRALVTQKGKKRRRKLTHKLEKHSSLQYQDGNDSIAKPTDEVAIQQEMKKWMELGNIPHPLLRALWDLKFYRPTEIQKRTIPLVVMGDNDIIGAAETVSRV